MEAISQISSLVKEYITPETVWLVPFLDALGSIIKKSVRIDDTLIPTVLCVVGVFLSALVSVAACEPTNWIQWIILVSVSVGTEALYGARPKPDTDGIYPYVYNMGIYEGMLVRDDDGVLYRSITGTQERPTELLYHPKDVPALLEKVEEGGEEAPSEEYPEWVQPTGAHDAYDLNAKVSHNGKKWISQIAANTTEPGADERYWKEYTE